MHFSALGPNGKQIWHTIGSTQHFTLDEARKAATAVIKAIKSGEDSAPPSSFEAVAAQWIKRHVDQKGLRSKTEIERHLGRMTKAWHGRNFESIRRGDVAKLLDDIEDNHGTRAADLALATIRSMANWYATRHETYMTPVVKGMARQSPKEAARKRMLNDDELRALWKLAAANGSFGGLVRLLLLTGQRLEKVRLMRWDDIAGDVWTIPAEEREKGNAGALVLPKAALDIINAQPRFASNDYVFAGRGDRAIGVSHGKEAFDAKLAFAQQWQLHDLRRTARSLMSRAHVRGDVAERVMGHAIRGVEGVYDRHEYREEKAHALQALAALIETILNPVGKNVVQLRA